MRTLLALPTPSSRPKAQLQTRRREIIDITVSQVFAVPLDLLKSETREEAEIARARQVAMYLAHVIGSMPMNEVGQAFGRDRTTVSYACQVIEDRRDEPCFNRTLDLLEGIIRRLWRLSFGPMH